MFLSLVLTVSPTESATVPVNLGAEMQGWFLREVRRCDPAMSAWLHESNQRRPYAVSGLMGVQGAYEAKARVHAGSHYTVRVASAHPLLSEFLALHWLPQMIDSIRLDSGTVLRIVDRATLARSHPWAGSETALDIVARASGTEDDSALEIDFASPTTFRSQGVYIPLPIPRLIFQGLATAWRDVPGVALAIPDDFGEIVERSVLVSRYTLHTERVVFSHDKQRHDMSAFVGRCRFSLKRLDTETRVLARALAHFALYTGVGSHTALGLGQARVV